MTGPDKDQTVLPRIGDFYPRLFQNSWLIFLASEIIGVSIIIVILVLLQRLFSPGAVLVIIVPIIILLQSFIGYMFLHYVLKPTDMITRALAQMNGESSTLPLPNRNDASAEKSGLKKIIDSLYELKTGQSNDKASKQVACDQNFLANILSSLPVGLIALDADHKIIAINSLAPTFVDESGNRQIQLDFSDTSDSLDQWLKNVSENQISADNIWPRIQNVAPGSTTERKIYDVIAQYKKDSPNGIETILITVDRTAEYDNDENNMDFIALAAHELRGPITVIRGYLNILDYQIGSTLTPEQHDLIDRLNVSSKRLSSYINNILNASRYDRRHLQLKLSETSVSDIISDIRDDMELRAKTLNRHLAWQGMSSLPTVAADRSSVSEVLSNLIDNAIKYSKDNSSIEIKAEIDGDFVAISVHDHGIGIPSVVAEHLFSKFYRSHRSRGAISGTGLGLYISRAIVESHGGHIGVQSTEGKGSIFTFTLPTFASVADKLGKDDSNSNLIRQGGNWIRNHSKIQE